MNEITLTIDGKPVTARPGQTILEVIREHRLADIPTLCHEPKLPPYGACYLCVVEVEGVAKLIPSCSSPAADKMVVRTDNARIREARKTASSCCSPTTTPTASRPASRPARPASTSRAISPSSPWASRARRCA